MKDWWEVLGVGVDPSEEEVVVSVWHAFDGFEPFVDGGLVELSSDLLLKRKCDDVEASVSCPLNPCFEWVDLDTSTRPVPSALAFHNVELALTGEVQPNGHG